jgi:hypothetical protein
MPPRFSRVIGIISRYVVKSSDDSSVSAAEIEPFPAKVPTAINNIIFAMMMWRYCVGLKADIFKCDDHADAR